MTAADQAPDLPIFDLLVIGGGINGTGIARDAAGRGLSVMLVEAEDLAQHTSSASTKLIHGGLRYLEYGEFRLVREALIERERLWGMAPHIIWPLRFVLPQVNSPRPAWMVRLGLFLYDNLGGRKRLPATETIDLARAPQGEGLVPGARRAFVYSDCWVEDSRLVVLNAIDAATRGAVIATRTRALSAVRQHGEWIATISDEHGPRGIRARAIVNAAGPWVEDVLQRTQDPQAAGNERKRGVRLIKGSHIVVPRLYGGDHAFLLQNPDRRVVFAIPYEGEFTLVGTTDEPWNLPPGPATISAGETDYLLDTIRRYFTRPVSHEDIRWSFAGIRPLYDDHAANASAVTRDYVLDLDAPKGAAPLLSVFGGKITTFRKLAEHAMEKLGPHFPMAGPAWTAGATLPGGDLPGGDFDAFAAELAAERPAIPARLVRRLARAYGTRAEVLLAGVRTSEDLGRDFGGGLTEAEVRYLAQHEWAKSAADVLWRRSKMGLHVLPQAEAAIDAVLAAAAHG